MDPAVPTVESRWVHTVAEGCQAFLGGLLQEAGSPTEWLPRLLAMLPAPRTAMETRILRGMLAEMLLHQLTRAGVVPFDCLDVLNALRAERDAAGVPASPPSAHPKVRAALALMRNRLAHANLQLTHVAAAVQVSGCHLSRLLRRETGLGFAAHLRNLRLAQATVLLAWTDDSIKQIAGAVGYKRPGDFSRDFGSRFGVPPTVWRRRHGG
jgi:AraC-like DNA-binding protein